MQVNSETDLPNTTIATDYNNGFGVPVRYRNVLMHDLSTAFNHGVNSATNVAAEHLTAHRVSTFCSSSDSSRAVKLTNSLLIAVTNTLNWIGGSDVKTNSDTGVFTTVGAGARYLAAGSTYRNAGTTNISTNLLAELRQRTTYGPEVLTGTTIMYCSNLTQRAFRDNDSLPDLGYHYDAIDWCVGNLSVTNCNLTVEPGVVVAAFTNKGIILQKEAKLLCSGTATQMAVLTRYSMVQEEANTNWMATTQYYSSVSVESASTNSGFMATFTKCTLPAGSGRHFYTGGTNDTAGLGNCQVFGGEILFEQGASLGLTNNLFVRSATRLQYLWSSFTGLWRNNTFVGGTADWECTNTVAGNVIVNYNVFDNTTIIQSNAVTAGSNAYLTNATKVTNSSGDYVFTTNVMTYQKGDLGDYYLPAALVDYGPDYATNVGLYHFTTQTNNAREQGTLLDIGFHYLALTNGVPFDSDGDGEPDYLEDTDGNGVQGPEERNWRAYDTDSDYDGRTDYQETNEDGTDPHDPLSVKRTRLGYWRFNTNTWIGEQGQLPTITNGLQPVATWHGNAMKVGASQFDGARYREIETTTSATNVNFNLRSGTVRFWYRPNWSSVSVGGTGPPGEARLFQVGSYSDSATYGLWQLAFNGTNSHISFGAQSNGVHATYIDAPDAQYTFISDRWYQFALTYSPSNVALYVNGELLAKPDSIRCRPWLGVGTNLVYLQNQGHGIAYWPPAHVRRAGFFLGGGDGKPSNGAFEELEIYNYPLSAQEIARDFPNFNGAAGVTTDFDYDGRTGLLETWVDGTQDDDPADVVKCRLAYLRFHSPSTNQHLMLGEALQNPIYTNNAIPTAAWSSNALGITSQADSGLAYRDVETNGWPNFNCRNGAVTFWFKPDWSTGSAGPYFLSMGTPLFEHWEFRVSSDGTQLSLRTASNYVITTVLTGTTNINEHRWYHIALNYTRTNSALYVNSTLIATNVGVTSWPSANERAYGLFIGNNRYGATPTQGFFDELQTFNYPLTSAEIKRQYDTVVSMDPDLNGVPDLLEDSVLPAPRPFTGAPFAITGTIEAEQFDLGGLGVAYSNSVANYWTNDYRPSGMEITNCNDIGLGYAVNNLRSNDWLKYSIDVRVAQNYVVEARMAGIGTNGGVFKVEFYTNNAASPYTNTGPLIVASTNWHDVKSPILRLNKGTNVMKISFLTNAPGSSYIGKFNYVSIYPGFNPGVTNIIATNVVSGLQPNENWFTATNNAWLIQSNINTLPPSTNGGGVVVIPAGRWFVAPKEPNEQNSFVVNGAVYVSRSNTEIRGAGPDKTNTTLIPWFRSTSAFVVGYDDSPQPVAVTNFTLRDISFEGRPHNRALTNGAGGGFQTTWEAAGMKQIGGEIGSLVTVSSYVDQPPTFTNYTQNLLFTNCLFRNPGTYSLVCPGRWSNCLVTACDFIFRDTTFDPTNGVWPFPRTTTYPTNTTRDDGPDGQVGVMTRSGSTYNTLVISNTFSGNPAIIAPSTNWFFDVPDAIFWGQEGGNWFIARNSLTNHGLEGIEVEGGPVAAVGNRYKTFISTRSTSAINARAGSTSVNGTHDDPQDYSFYFVGNSVEGPREGERSEGSGNYLPYTLHFTGNALTLSPSFPRVDDLTSAAIAVNALAFGNFSGNTLLAGEAGVRWTDACTNSLVLKNDFGAASWRALEYYGSNGYVRNIQIVRNVLNQGNSYHLKLKYPDSGGFFLQQNAYTNGTSTVDPFIDPASSPVHIMR